MKQIYKSRATGKLSDTVAVLAMKINELENEVEKWRGKYEWCKNLHHRQAIEFREQIKRLNNEIDYYRAFIRKAAKLPYFPLATTLDIKREAKKILGEK